MKQWFEGLAKREQIIVGLGAVLVILALFYLLVWSPLTNGTERLQRSVADKQALLANLARWQGRLSPPQSGSGAAASAGQSLVVLVSQTVDRFELSSSLKSSQPAGSSAIRVQFEAAPFDTLVIWLGELQKSHGLSVQSASFNRTAASGRVDSTLTLERS